MYFLRNVAMAQENAAQLASTVSTAPAIDSVRRTVTDSADP
jgi:hypothetical protein